MPQCFQRLTESEGPGFPMRLHRKKEIALPPGLPENNNNNKKQNSINYNILYGIYLE